LKDFIMDKLRGDGWLAAEKLQERDKMKPKQRRDAANQIVDSWQEAGVVKALYGDFKRTLEQARNKSTTGGRRYR